MPRWEFRKDRFYFALVNVVKSFFVGFDQEELSSDYILNFTRILLLKGTFWLTFAQIIRYAINAVFNNEN